MVPKKSMRINNKKNIFVFLSLFLFSLFLFPNLAYHQYNKVFAQDKCTVEPAVEIRFAEFPKGEIPIGETVDETELFSQEVINELENIYNEADSIKNNALATRDEAEAQINEAEDEIDVVQNSQIPKVQELIDLTSEGFDNTRDCVHSCPVVCTTSCKTGGGCGTCCAGDPPVCVTCKWWKYCKTCSGTPCPSGAIISAYNNIDNYYNSALGYYNNVVAHYNNIVNYYNGIVVSLGKIPNYLTKFTDLIEAKNLLADDPNRWEILNKLLNSRVKLRECITGYGFTLSEIKTKMEVLSCDIAVDKKDLGELIISGYFEDKVSPFPHCYPYNTPAAKPICEKNKNSLECREETKDLMDNYFCCEG